MKENFKSELKAQLKQISKSIESSSLTDLANKIEDVYEKILLADYLETRNQKREKIHAKILKEASKAGTESSSLTTKKQKQPIGADADFNEDNFSMTPEIKVVPHPDGPPPMPRDLEDESPAEKIEVAAQPVQTEIPVETISETVEAKNKTSIAERAQAENKSRSLNTQLASKTLKFTLNDRVAYVKHLFEGNAEDFNRVVSQLNSFDSWGEANDFLNNIIKPDYNWDDKEEFEERFVNQVKTRFE